jgi:sulfatase modifying factor 1
VNPVEQFVRRQRLWQHHSQMTDHPGGDMDGCCAPLRPDGATLAEPASAGPASSAIFDSDHELVDLPGGAFIMGSNEATKFPNDGEGPAREVVIKPFSISPYTVTNEQFAAFVDATGHITDAERFGWSFVFHLFLPDDFEPTRAVQGAEWWRQVYGADWAHPAGPQSALDGIIDHPVVHVSWTDAAAYCVWAEVRLPTEAEWEFAARGGLVQKTYGWGDEFAPGGETMCNIFEGRFPIENTAADGYIGTAPVDTFPSNGYQLHNMAGNVWEWCHDWFSPTTHRDGATEDPAGPPDGENRVIRGGSYLCHDSYCTRYRVAARTSNSTDGSTGNMGFRVAADTAS